MATLPTNKPNHLPRFILPLSQPLPTAEELLALVPKNEPLPPEEWPSVDHLVTEDDTPVDNIYSEKQQRLLTSSLYASWQGPGNGHAFITFANVGLFYSIGMPALVPDVLVSLDVTLPVDIWTKRHRSYMIWQYGKPPEVVLEVVSNTSGGEATKKLQTYALMGVWYYVIYDPEKHLSEQVVQVYERQGGGYQLRDDLTLPQVELSLVLWQGRFEDRDDTWLRWQNSAGHMLLTGEERAAQEYQRAEQEHQRAEQEHQHGEQERLRAEQAEQQVARLAARLRELGIEPEA